MPKGAKKLEKAELLRNSRENLEWFRANYDDLKKDFDKQWVVVQNKKVVAKCSTYDEIMSKVKGARGQEDGDG